MNARLARTALPTPAGQPTTLGQIEQAAASYGVAPGAKAMMQAESRGAQRAVASGVYIVWRSKKNGADCSRVGSDARCFCGHALSAHKAVSKSNPQPPPQPLGALQPYKDYPVLRQRAYARARISTRSLRLE